MAVKVIERRPLSFWERTYLPQVIGGLRVTWRNILRPAVTLQYPEQRPTIPNGYRGVPTLVRDPNGREKCVSCQLCEFVCPPKAIRITPGDIAATSENAHVEKAPKEFDINIIIRPGSMNSEARCPTPTSSGTIRSPRRSVRRAGTTEPPSFPLPSRAEGRYDNG